MSSGNNSNSEPLHRRLLSHTTESDQSEDRQQRRIANERQMMRITEPNAADDAAGKLGHAGGPTVDPPTEEEVTRRGSLEASERQAAAKRQQEWEQLRKELENMYRLDPPIITQRLDGNSSHEQDQARLNHPQHSPRPDVSDPDVLPPGDPVSTQDETFHRALDPEIVGGSDADDEMKGSDESGEDDSSDEDNKADASGNPSAHLPRTRYISMKTLNEQGLMGVGIYSAMYRNEATDALYFLNNLGEKIWLTHENGDCVLAQHQNLD